MRLPELRKSMREKGLSCMIVSEGHNIRYLSGFTGEDALLVITDDAQIVATDFRYYDQVYQECPGWELFRLESSFSRQFPSLVERLGLDGKEVGFEDEHLTVAALHKLGKSLNGKVMLTGASGMIEDMRMVKGPEEIEATRRAVAIADDAIAHVYDLLRPGLTERDIAWELESYMRTHGAEGLSFPPIVGFGPQGALAHAPLRDVPVEAGLPIVMDLGCVVEGYCSDVTRTVCLGEPRDEKYLEIWELVLAAQEMAEQNLKAGMTGIEGDALARDVIKEAGYGENFGHGLGHGVGLNIHEEPRLSTAYKHALPAGAVVTVEPGVYISGWGGVRIEDMVIVLEDGIEVLTSVPKVAVIPLKS